jgi:hypothetical protein
MTPIGSFPPPNSKNTLFFLETYSGILVKHEGKFWKTKPTSQAEVLGQPIFSNPLVSNIAAHPLGVNRISEGGAIAKVNCTKIKDLWDLEDRKWKSLPTLKMNSHIINRTSKNAIISNIP